jgi:hypothetical protein
MTDYTKLVEALRCCEFGWSARTCDNCEYSKTDCPILLSDAADAIEALQAQLPKRGEIVRCRECKWYSIYEAKKDGSPDKRYSPSVCLRGEYAKRRDPDWYCADGEMEVQDA